MYQKRSLAVFHRRTGSSFGDLLRELRQLFLFLDGSRLRSPVLLSCFSFRLCRPSGRSRLALPPIHSFLQVRRSPQRCSELVHSLPRLAIANLRPLSPGFLSLQLGLVDGLEKRECSTMSSGCIFVPNFPIQV